MLLLILAAAALASALATFLVAARGCVRGVMSPGRDAKVWWRRRLRLAALGCLVVGALGYVVGHDTALSRADRAVARWSHEHGGGASAHALTLVTHLGSKPFLVVLALGIGVFESVRMPDRWLWPLLVAVLVGETLAVHAIKDLAGRARPAFDPAAATLGPSYPSGHAAAAAAFYATAALVLARGRSPITRAALTACAAGVAVGVAASRVLLDLHWLTDVVGGLALGWAWFSIATLVLMRGAIGGSTREHRQVAT